MLRKNRILITGINGFIGKNLVKRLIKENWEIYAIIRTTTDIDTLNSFYGNKINFYVYKENVELYYVIEKIRPDITVHLASQYLTEHEYMDIPNLIKNNIIFGTSILDALVRNDCKKFVNIGTSWQHFNNEPYNPVNLYAATKQAFRDITVYFEKAFGLECITLELFDTYGDNDNRPKILNLIKKHLKSGEVLETTKGEQKLNLLHVDDVINGIMLSVKYLMDENIHCYGDFVISNNNTVSLFDLVKRCEKISNKKINIKWGARPYRRREVMTLWDKGEKLPGWEQLISLDEGLKDFMKDII